MTDRKTNIINLLKEADGTPRKVTRPRGSLSIVGNGNIQANGNININTKKIERSVVQPGPQHITEEQAFKLSELVKKAVEIESITGKEKDKLFMAWWSKLKKHYKVTSYKLIPYELGDEAISYMLQEVAKLRPKLRRRDNDAWRKELYSAIYARTRELGKDKPWVYDIVSSRIGKTVDSLTQLGEQDLKKLHGIIMRF